jgi:quinol monooxygenase YgiN
MSVIMTMTMPGDPQALERFAAEHEDAVRAIADQAKERGLIAHRFYGTEGQIMVADEWPDEESFQGFFESTRAEIQQMMEGIVLGEPEIVFWRKLETHDDVGWD